MALDERAELDENVMEAIDDVGAKGVLQWTSRT
jgi:hypothetical protein